jgi:acyl transferase domain-containing protein/NADPH:quinone reductase-like Zn-dependent oxidoreductase/acyl carrier protein
MNDGKGSPIAVIGMGCRLPGGIDSPDRFWESLVRGVDLVTEIPADRWDVDEYFDAERGVPDRSVSRWGAFLDKRDMAGFDYPFFGIGEREALAMDPQHRLALETAWQAVEHAGIAPASLAGSKTGVYIGLSHDDYRVMTYEAGELGHPYSFTGLSANMASGRIAYAMGLNGPAVNIDTACSTGLVAIHLACRSLAQGDSDMALAGASMVMLEPLIASSESAQGMLSPNGRCRPFDRGADGFVRAEGCGVVLLKRLSDAVRDGDRILAVVRGSASNQDGRTHTITSPSGQAQEAVYRAAVADAGVDAATITVIEAHGTGTPVGDPLEFRSLAAVYGKDGVPCAVGSAKSNIGHSEAAAGVVSFIKTVMSVRHGLVPPMLHFTGLPDDLKDVETGLFVPEHLTPWPGLQDGQPRRAGVTSFGMSGTNVHVIIEEAPEISTVAEPAEHAPLDQESPKLFAISASSADGLRQTADRIADWLESESGDVAVADVAYTLSRRRGFRPVRAAVVASDRNGLVKRLRGVAAETEIDRVPAVGNDVRWPVWVFSGHGSQWAAMGAELLASEPVFAKTVAEIEPMIFEESGFSVTAALTTPDGVTATEHVQPAIFAVQVGLAATLQSYGVRPGAVVGHSMGEAAAAVVAGALSMRDGVSVICRRSLATIHIAGTGAMVSVELPAAVVAEELRERGYDDTVVSVVASPNSTVIGGGRENALAMLADWESRDILAREVAVDVAAHSPHVDPILDDLGAWLQQITPLPPKVPFYSATLENPRGAQLLDADYWVKNARYTVRFMDAINALLEDGYRVFGELAPHPLLTRAISQTSQAVDIEVAALPAMRRREPLPDGMLGFVGEMYSAGAEVDFAALCPNAHLVDAPAPVWDRQQLLIGSEPKRNGSRGRTVSVHPLLGSHVRLPEQPVRHAWQADVGTAALPWLADHQVGHVAAFPGAGYCEMALSAARATLGDKFEVCDLRFREILFLDEQTSVACVATQDSDGVLTFSVDTDADGDLVNRADAILRAAADDAVPPSKDLSALLAASPERIEGARIREWFAARGIVYGPAFTGLVAVHTSTGSNALVAELALPSQLRAQQNTFGIHPALLDVCFQALVAPMLNGQSGTGLMLPLGVRRLRMYGPTQRAAFCVGHIISCDDTTVEADIDVVDEHGAMLLTAQGLRMGSRSAVSGDRDELLLERLMGVDWQPRTLPSAQAAPGSWLVTAAVPGEARAATAGLVAALAAAGASCATHDLADDGGLGESWAEGADSVVVVCPPSTPVDDATPDRGREMVGRVVRIAQSLARLPGRPPRLYVITHNAQAVSADDEINLTQCGLRGLLRVVGAEQPQLRVTQIDADVDTSIESVAAELLSGSTEDETAWRSGSWYCARLRPAPLTPGERRTADADFSRDGVRLEIRTPGDLESLEFNYFERTPPGPGQIEVAVSNSSVNFADVLIAFERYPTFNDTPPAFGLDFAGVVTAVGEGVTSHRVGDRVGGFRAGECWATFVVCDERLAVSLPDELPAEHAAAAATVYATAWHGLHTLARIGSGDRVLIHSATGGVGQAAISIARRAGATIFATAGSPGRRQLLRDWGIEHVYDSRTLDFADEIRRDTDGYGVDIVLNSLTGMAQRAGIDLLAIGGRFVEIGKLDVYGHTRVDLYPFRRNLEFYVADLGLMSESQPGKIQDLLRTVFPLLARGELEVPQRTVYPLSDAADAIRSMRASEHTGKILLDIPHDIHDKVVIPPDRARPFRADGSYIVTGGFGGLGLFLAELMAAHGAGRIVLSSRSRPKAEVDAAVARMRANGADIVMESADISQAATAQRLVELATAGGHTLRGVLHAAGVVEDSILENVTDDLINHDWAPKANGAWHLANATSGHTLDWFCMFSSVSALLGSRGQSAYAAANSWLDGFTHWCRSRGVPASSIAWGAWDEIGRGAGLAARGDTVMIDPKEGGYAFWRLLTYDRPYAGYTPFVGTPWLDSLAARSPFAEAFRAQNAQEDQEHTDLLAELLSLPSDERPDRIRKVVGEQVSLILRRRVDPDRPFSDHGLDSLGSLELRTQIETNTGIRMSQKAITTHNTVRSLAVYLSECLSGDPVH